MRPVRLGFLLASLACLVGSSVRAADALLTNVWAEWREAASFDRIGEYFGRAENQRNYQIRRTHADVRAGFYFFLRLANVKPPADARFELQIIRPDSPDPKSFTFSAESPKNDPVFELGLTGADWPGGKNARPVAWRLALVAADGRVLAEQKSFLWENPAK